ncbi:hypothetical protein YC2023_114680 [Brassica napus]
MEIMGLIPNVSGVIPWIRLGSGPLHPGGLYLGWRQGPTPSTAFDDKMGISPPPGIEPGNMTIDPQISYQTSYHIPSSIIPIKMVGRRVIGHVKKLG